MKLIIAGAGGHGRVVADVALASGIYSDVAFLDDRYPNIKLPEAWSVIGTLASLEHHLLTYRNFVAAFGDAKLRLDILKRAINLGFDCPVISHPSAVISKHASLGKGTVVIAGAVVNIGANLGEGCIINTSATIDHDCVIADGAHVCPGAHLAGNVVLGLRSWFGIGAVAKQAVSIGSDVLVGAAAVVVEDIPSGLTVAGNPARPVKKNNEMLIAQE